MPNDIGQQPNISGDKSAAALAFATSLSEQLMPKQEIPQEGEEVMNEEPLELEEEPVEEGLLEPEEEEIPEESLREKPKEENLSKEFEEFKGEIKGIIETKFDELIKALKKDE